jgi:thioredoxin type arsenate reductase
MAEGWARHLKGDVIESYSAGIETHGLNPNAVKVMAEAGVDISQHQSKQVDSLKNVVFDYVITVCDNANESCPMFPGKTKVIHVGFDDPPRLAKEANTEQDALDCYRRVRDEIRAFVETLPESLKSQGENNMQKDNVRQSVREGYAEIAKGKSSCCCGSGSPKDFASQIGYTTEELDALPEGANLGLSCGNPTAIANLKPGQTVLDLGSGAGFDVFIAAKKVGATGLAIGVDMTPQMLDKARNSIAVFQQKTGLSNVEFRLGEIEHLPVADTSVDVVISNCVINLSADKPQVWREVGRVLKPGGKACVSDIALKKPLPETVRQMVIALVGCVAGAVPIEETVDMAKAAGLANIQWTEKEYAVDVMEDCNDKLYQSVKDALPKGEKLSDYIVSVNLSAEKPK